MLKRYGYNINGSDLIPYLLNFRILGCSEDFKGKTFSKELYPNYGMRGKHHAEETKGKMRGKHHTEETKEKISQSLKEYYVLEETKRHHSDETKKQISRSQKITMNRPEVKKKLGISMKISMKKLWQKEEYKEKQIKAVLKGLLKRPTSFEQKISNLCFKYNLPFFYTGDGRFLIGYKNPDFRHKNLPILIEVYNDFHHPKDYEEKRRKHFSKFGYKTIFINQKEVLDKNWEEVCLEKINNIYKISKI